MSQIKLYSVSDSPWTLAVRMLMQAIELPHEIVNMDFVAGDHLTEEYAKINPQKEVPCLDDNGFLLSDSTAILQYIADKYAKNDSLYPRDHRKRAVVNHRFLFNITTYAKCVYEYAVAPVFYSHAYKRTPEGLEKLHKGLGIFNTYLERGGTKFAAGDTVTIADFSLVCVTFCLEALDFSIESFPLVVKWYEDFKRVKPDLWSLAEKGMLEMKVFVNNPPDMSVFSSPLRSSAE